VPDDPTSAPNPDLTAEKKAAGIAGCPTTHAAPAKGGLPDVAVECLGGGPEVRLSALRGPALVNVWASWCGPCRSEAPFLAQVGRAGSPVSVIGVDHADPAPAVALEFARGAGWTYPQLYDADLVFRTRLQVTALPVTFFVRADGTVAGRHAGPFTSAAQLADETREHLGVTP
ncbi:MAG: TlpA family protein disulfide reductase, partial [Propionibacteriaceae bacterium]